MVIISQPSIVVPAILGAVMAVWLFPSFAGTGATVSGRCGDAQDR